MKNISTGNFRPLLIGAMGLLFAVFIGWVIGTESYRLLVVGTVILTGLLICFSTGRFFWVLAIASSFLGGAFSPSILSGTLGLFLSSSF